MNASAVRKAFEEGVARMEQALAADRRIAWLSLGASVVALTAALCAIFVRVFTDIASMRCQKPLCTNCVKC
jgi:hypothetical protein